MNAINTNENLNAEQSFAHRCAQSCKKLLAAIEQARLLIANEFRGTLKSQEHLLQLALNEAEALARQTAYPHLLFPALAMEKAQAVAAWQTRQRSLQQRRPVFAEAA
jgi:hypothetical protein